MKKNKRRGGLLRVTTSSSARSEWTERTQAFRGLRRSGRRERERQSGKVRERKKCRELRSSETLTQTPSEWSAAVLERERRIEYTITLAVCSPVRYLSPGVRVLPDRNSNIGYSSARVADLGIEWRPIIMDRMIPITSPRALRYLHMLCIESLRVAFAETYISKIHEKVSRHILQFKKTR